MFNRLFIFFAVVVLTAGCIDFNPEAMMNPLTVGYMEKARQEGIPFRHFCKTSPLFDDYKIEDRVNCRAYEHIGGLFPYDYFALANPMINICYLPFVRGLGVQPLTILMYSVFWSVVALLILGFVVYGLWGWKEALLSVLMVMSSLVWIIHARVAYSPWFPSIALMLLIFHAVWRYVETFEMKWLILAGTWFGLLALVGWLATIFGIVIIAGALLFAGKSNWINVIGGLALSVWTGLMVFFSVGWIYAHIYGYRIFDIIKTIWCGTFTRFSQGADPTIIHHGLEKLRYALKCVCVDSTTTDHLDKCLQGYPAIPYLLSFLFLVGMGMMLVKWSRRNVFVLWCLVSIGVVVVFVQGYAHRYFLFMLPFIAMIAARVVCRFSKWIVGFVAVLFVLQTGATVYLFANQYTRYKPYDFEENRMRGHYEAAELLKSRFNPEDTIVILNDSVMINSTQFTFNHFNRPYRFKYMNNYMRLFTSTNAVLTWEKSLNCKNVFFIFSHVLLKHADGTSTDCRPLLTAHDEVNLEFNYEYNGRPLFFCASAIPEGE